MLEVNLAHADEAVEQFISDTCSEIGQVTSVKVYRLPHPFALIEMSRRSEAADLAAQLRGSNFGICMRVRLKHKP
jgi:hypothetical protein